MNMTIADVMRLEIMEKARIVAGQQGCNNSVEYVDVLESSEGYQWLRKNTLLITSLLPIRDDEEAQRLFLQHLHSVQVAAVAIKPKRFVERIPEFMLTDADKYSIPIIELPMDAVYSDLVSKISQLIINAHAFVIQATLSLSKMFTDVVQNGGGIDEIAQTLSKNVGRPVIIEDRDFHMLSYACEDEQLKKNSPQILSHNNRLKSVLKNNPPPWSEQNIFRLSNHHQPPWLSMAAIIFNNQCVGYISIVESNNKFDEIHDIALQNAATVAALIIATIKSNQEKEAMIKYGILTDLVFGNTYTQENITAWLDYFGWEKNACYVASILRVTFNRPQRDNEKNMENNLFHVFAQLVQEILPDVLIIPQTKTLIFVHKIEHSIMQYREEMTSNLNYLRDALKEYALQPYCNICIGQPVNSLMDICHSYQQALVAMNISEHLSGSSYNYGLFFYEDLDIYHIFTQYHNKEELAGFSARYLNPLLHNDKLKFDALATLEAYISTGCSINKSAKILYLHVNTMKYRIAKIKEILDNPLSDYIYLYKLYMSICIHKVI